MALPSIGGGRQFGDGNINEIVLGTQATPVTLTSAVTLTPAQLTNGILSATPGSALSYTLPTVADLEALLVNAKNDSSFDFAVINLSAANIGTIATATGWTLVGTMGVPVSTSVQFRARKTGAGAWTLYTIG